MSARVLRVGGILAAALTLILAGTAAAAAVDTEFVIHDGNTEVEPIVGGAITVCTFHLHAVPTGSDDHETGIWEIRAPDGTVVLSGDYETIGDQDDRIPDSGTMSLPNGNYTLFWDSEPIDDSHRAKAFVVDCGGGAPTATPSPTPSSSPTESPSPTPSATGGGIGGAPTGGVAPTTGVNPIGSTLTLPPTDAGSVPPTPRANDGGAWTLAAALAVAAGVVFLATPRPASRARRIRR